MIRRHLKIQRLLFYGLVIAIGLAALRFLALQGLMIPIRVTSGSMVPWLRGERFRVACADCEFDFEMGFESQPRDERAVCPNCGYGANRLRDAERLRGQRVLIDRGAFWFEPPKRFDAVAFDDTKNRRLVVKRAVALPGERIAIRDGELYVDGRMVRKTLAQFRLLAVTVHDNHFLPKKTKYLPLRWRAETDESGWRSDTTGVRFVPVSPRVDPAQPTPQANPPATPQAISEFDWLVYHHWRCFASTYLRTAEAPIADNYGYNQGESRALEEVSDLLLRSQVRFNAAGRVAIRVHDGKDWVLAVVDGARRQVSVTRSAVELATSGFPPQALTTSIEVEFGIVDGQVVLAIDRQELVRKEYERSGEGNETLNQPIAIGGDLVELAVELLDVQRDVYYLGPGNRGDAWESDQKVLARHVYCLGDNPPLSEDSRLWGEEGVDVSAIQGKVLPLPW